MRFIVFYFVLFGFSYFVLKIREKFRNIPYEKRQEIPPSIWLSVVCPPMGIVFGIVDIILWKFKI